MSKPYLREPLTVFRHEFADIEATATLLKEKLWVLAEQMEEVMKEYALEDPLISKEYEQAYDILEEFATNFSFNIDDYKKAIKKGMGE